MLYQTTIAEIKTVAKNTIELTVVRPDGYHFFPGQYTQLQLPHLVQSDPKGNTRQFSIASAPDEQTVLRFLFRQSGSGFKETIVASRSGDPIVIEHAAGSFRLPLALTNAYVFVAGGVGIAPFMSMVQQIVINGHTIAGTFLYGNQSPETAAYLPFLQTLIKTHRHFALEEIYKKPTPDLFARYAQKRLDTTWFIVGPPPMVATTVEGIQSAGIHPQSIRTESFTGY